MTAHRSKPTITPERIAWFRSYKDRNPEWGVFHVSLADHNYDRGASEFKMHVGSDCTIWDLPRSEWSADERDAADWFDKLTPSQRRRLARKASS